MNTEAIRKCINNMRTETVGVSLQDGVAAAPQRGEMADQADTELIALEADNAAKDEALRKIIDSEAPYKRDPLEFARSVIFTHIKIAEAALSPPTGKDANGD